MFYYLTYKNEYQIYSFIPNYRHIIVSSIHYWPSLIRPFHLLTFSVEVNTAFRYVLICPALSFVIDRTLIDSWSNQTKPKNIKTKIKKSLLPARTYYTSEISRMSLKKEKLTTYNFPKKNVRHVVVVMHYAFCIYSSVKFFVLIK